MNGRFTASAPKDLASPAEIEAYMQEKRHQFQIRVVRFIKVCERRKRGGEEERRRKRGKEGRIRRTLTFI